MHHARFVMTTALVLALGVIAPARAGDELTRPGEATRPWAADVDTDDQERATELFYEGNKLLRDSLFAKAAARYREALKHWEHPRIHYNLALALMNLERPIEAYQTFERAMRHGPEALDPDKFQQAQNYHNLFGQQIARVEIHCDEPGAEVALDGEVLFRGPGTYRGLVQIGEHRLVASKPGFLTRTKALLLTSGQKLRIELDLLALDETTRTVRRWSQWKPWTVVAGGTLIAAAGGLAHWLAVEDYRRYDTEVTKRCDPDYGCSIEQKVELDPIRQRASYEQWSAIAAYSVGSAILATGAVLLYMNRARTVRIDIDDDAPVSLQPMVAPDAAGVAAAFRF